jgi:hypothetical protein
MMLVLGICNPKGEAETYNGLYFRDSELRDMVDKKLLHGLPVRTEHGSGDIGFIVSTHMRMDGALQCMLSLHGEDLHDQIAQGFVRDGVALDLSLGYSVDVKQSDTRLLATSKNVLEVSLVKKGARRGCHILAFQDTDKPNKPAFIRKDISQSTPEPFFTRSPVETGQYTKSHDPSLGTKQFIEFVKCVR